MFKAVRITLRGQGGELDSRVVESLEDTDPFETRQVNFALYEIVSNSVFSIGDTITIEEVD